MNHLPADVVTQLESLAEAFGVQTSYRDLNDNVVQALPDSLFAVLRAMGVLDHRGDIADALMTKHRADWAWFIEPVIVAWDGRLRSVSLRVPEAARESLAGCSLHLEGEDRRSRDIPLAHAPVEDATDIDDERWLQVRLDVKEDLPLGYHRLVLEVGDHRLESLLIAAPRQAHRGQERRAWGLFLPLHALHSRRSWGIGDYTDLRDLVRWTGSKGGSFVGTLPLLPAFLDKPLQPSPYQPVSRLFWNEVYVDVEAPIAGVEPPVSEALRTKARSLTGFEEVPHRAVMGVKRQAMMEQLQVLEANSEVMNHLGAFLASRPAVSDYARFRAAVERLGPDWREWPDEPRWGTLGPSDYDPTVARFYEFAQWRAETQMQAAAQSARDDAMRLYLDLPIGVHGSGYDAWRHRSLYAQQISVGAPPDLLASNGQDWDFQPLIPKVQRESGYAYLIEYLRHCLSAATMLRIDHAIGLHRLYWIPAGATGREGVFVRQPAEEIYAVLCLESDRYNAVLIGEDLGLVPPEVEAGLEEHGLNRMHVQMFELTGEVEEPVTPAPELSIASFSTHDLPAFAAYWQDEDLEMRRSLGLLTPDRVDEEIANRRKAKGALLAHLKQRNALADESDLGQVFRGSLSLQAEGAADWVVMNLEDAWLETHAQNLPGTSDDQHPNWVARAAHALEQFDSLDGLTQSLDTLRRHRAGTAQEGDPR